MRAKEIPHLENPNTLRTSYKIQSKNFFWIVDSNKCFNIRNDGLHHLLPCFPKEKSSTMSGGRISRAGSGPRRRSWCSTRRWPPISSCILPFKCRLAREERMVRQINKTEQNRTHFKTSVVNKDDKFTIKQNEREHSQISTMRLATHAKTQKHQE